MEATVTVLPPIAVECTWYQLTGPLLPPSPGQKSEGGADTDRIKHAEGVASLSSSSECHEQAGHLLSVSTIKLAARPPSRIYNLKCYNSMQNLWPNIGHVQIKTALRAFCLFAFVSCKMYKTFIGSMNWSARTWEKNATVTFVQNVTKDEKNQMLILADFYGLCNCYPYGPNLICHGYCGSTSHYCQT